MRGGAFHIGTIDRRRLRLPADLRTQTRNWHQRLKLAPREERTAPDGTLFASKGEMRRWCELQLLQRAGEIRNLRRQVQFELPGIKTPTGKTASWRCDFVYDEKSVEGWSPVVEDYKGFFGREQRLRIAVFEKEYGCKVRIVGPAAKRRRRPP